MTVATKTALLDAAEHVVAEEGVRGASLRAITKMAGANLAAVSYHFGSKEGLLQEVFTRRLAPINARRLELLDAAIAEPDNPDLDAVLRSFALPAIEVVKLHPEGQTLRRMMARVVYGERPEFMEELFHRNFAELFERYIAALSAALPHLERSALVLQFHFFIGVFAHTISSDDKLSVILPNYDPVDVEGITQSIVQFGADALLAADRRAEAAGSNGARQPKKPRRAKTSSTATSRAPARKSPTR